MRTLSPYYSQQRPSTFAHRRRRLGGRRSSPGRPADKRLKPPPSFRLSEQRENVADDGKQVVGAVNDGLNPLWARPVLSNVRYGVS
jgi:hypothetical protein